MEVIWYRYNHGLYVNKFAQAAEDYREMKRLGGEAVAFAITWEDDKMCRRGIKRNIALMREAGLRPILVFGRWGGLFSAAPLNASSRYTFAHPELWKVTRAGQPQRAALVCCVNNPAFREFFFEQLDNIVGRYQPDGILMDEPKDSNLPCYCEHCRKIGEPEKIHIPTLASFLGEICARYKRRQPAGRTYLFHMPGQSAELYELTAREKDLDYMGVDGPCCRQIRDDGKALNKTPLLESAALILPVARNHGRKTLVVPENFQAPAGAEESYYRNCRDLILKQHPDAVIFHHYGFENENPELLMTHIERLIAEARG